MEAQGLSVSLAPNSFLFIEDLIEIPWENIGSEDWLWGNTGNEDWLWESIGSEDWLWENIGSEDWVWENMGSEDWLWNVADVGSMIAGAPGAALT